MEVIGLVLLAAATEMVVHILIQAMKPVRDTQGIHDINRKAGPAMAIRATRGMIDPILAPTHISLETLVYLRSNTLLPA